MTLSDDEQDRLNELETFTQFADPGFADSLGGAAADRWQFRQSAFAWSASLLGILAMLAGLGAGGGLISIGTIVICYGFLLTAWGAGVSLQILKRKITGTRKTKEHS